MTNNRTILISINTSWNIYHFRAGLIDALRAAGYTIISAAPDDAYTEKLRTMVDQHIPLPMDNAGTSPLRDLLLFFRYFALLRRTKPAIMLTYTIKPNIYGSMAARLLGIPVIANVSGLGTTFIRQSWLTDVVKALYRHAFTHTARVFFQNPVDRDLFMRMQLVPAASAALLPGSGINLDYFKPVPLEPRASPSLRFVLIARLLWDKGIGEYVAAARIVKAQHPDAIFRLVGPKDVENRTAIPGAQLDAWVAEGVIDYLGPTEDARSVIAQHDCIVLPSYREGMSRVLLEAAAMGKPLIATDVPGCNDVVEHGKNGLLCASHDAESLAHAINQFLTMPSQERQRMGEESRAKAEHAFDEKHIFAAYLSAITELIAS